MGFIVLAFDFTEIMMYISQISLQFSKPSYNSETFLSPTGATGPRFLQPCFSSSVSTTKDYCFGLGGKN